MAGFTKLSSNLITSSIWQEDDKTRIVWITMLAMADMHGVVSATIPGLARLSGVSVDNCESALVILSNPDAYSRTKANSGKRIKEIEGGWLLLNYANYRENRDPETRRRQNREAQQRHRVKYKKSKPKVSQGKPGKAQAEAEVETEEEKEGKKKKNSSKDVIWDGQNFQTEPGLRQSWKEAYPRVEMDKELRKMEAWYKSNPNKQKKNHARFINNWLSKNQREAEELEERFKKAIPNDTAPLTRDELKDWFFWTDEQIDALFAEREAEKQAKERAK